MGHPVYHVENPVVNLRRFLLFRIVFIIIALLPVFVCHA